MGVDHQAKKLSAGRAVLVGHLWVNVPVLALIGLCGAISVLSGAGLAGFFVGIVLAWIFWSFSVPRWRRWALAQGAPPDKTQKLAAATGLTWPKGFILEKTEARLDDDRPRR